MIDRRAAGVRSSDAVIGRGHRRAGALVGGRGRRRDPAAGHGRSKDRVPAGEVAVDAPTDVELARSAGRPAAPPTRSPSEPPAGPATEPSPEPPGPEPEPATYRGRLGKARGLLSGYLGAVRARGQDRRRHLGRPRGGADPGRRRRRGHRRPARRPAGPGEGGRDRRARRPGRRPQGRPGGHAVDRRRRGWPTGRAPDGRPTPADDGDAGRARSTSGCSSGSTAWARPPRWARWPTGCRPTGHQGPAGRGRHLPGRGRRAAGHVGRRGPTPTSCGGPRAATRARWCSTPCSGPRPGATTWSWPTPPAACTTRST